MFFVGGFFLAVYLLINSRKLKDIINRCDYFYYLFLAVLTFASLLGIHPVESILGGSYRHQGVLFFFTLWLVMKFIQMLDNKKRNFLSFILTISIFLESLVLIMQKLFNFSLVNDRPIGTVGEANAAAIFIAIGLYFVIKTFQSEKIRGLIKWIFLSIMFLAILLSGSRTALLVVLLNIFLFRKEIFEGINVKKGYLITIYLILIGSSLFVITKAFMARKNLLFEDRFLYYELGIKEYLKRPWFGYGAESEEIIYNQAFKIAEMPLEGMVVERSHNLILSLLLWSGRIGLVSFCLWVIFEILELIKNKKKERLKILLLFFLFSMLQPLWLVHFLLLVLIFKL